MPGRLPNHGFREGSGEGSEPRVPGRFRTGSGAVGDNTWAYFFLGGGKVKNKKAAHSIWGKSSFPKIPKKSPVG